jgi:hypothetical protein
MTDKLSIKLNEESLASIIKSNLSCHHSKTLTQELIEEISKQIIETIDYFINNSNNK